MKLKKTKLRPNFRPKRLLLLLAPVAALFLELLPYGAVLMYTYANDAGTEPLASEYERHLFSYFDLFPFSFGNATPLLTGVFTCAIIGVVLFYTVFGKGWTVIVILSALDFILSMLPTVLLGIDYASVFAVFISIIIFSEIVITVKLRNFTK